MNTAHRRLEIIQILRNRQHITAGELAQEFGVSLRTIGYDIQVLSSDYPIYTKQGGKGGIFMPKDDRPYVNSLSPLELKTLCDLYMQAEGQQKSVLYRLIQKYGPANFTSILSWLWT
jgi:predicted DNA-binding transcriptional regulator YafY